MQMPDRDSHGRGNFRWAQARLQQVSLDVVMNLAAQFHCTRLGVRVAAEAGTQHYEIGLERGRDFLLRQGSGLVVERL